MQATYYNIHFSGRWWLQIVKKPEHNCTWRSRGDKPKGFETADDNAAHTQDIKENEMVSIFRKYFFILSRQCHDGLREQFTSNDHSESQILNLAESDTIPENRYYLCN